MTPKTSISPPRTPAHSEHVMESFQKTMQVFLDVQKATMLAYLSGRSPASSELAITTNGIDQALPTTAKRPDLNRVEIGSAKFSGNLPNQRAFVGEGSSHAETESNGAPAGRNGKPANYPTSPPTVQAAAMSSTETPDRKTITARLLEIVSNRTGYPIETLGLDLDIEADLGIDSIKRVEILGKLREEFPSLRNLPDSAEVMESLARARTLEAIVDRMATLANQAASSTMPQPAEPPSREVAAPAEPETPRIPHISSNGHAEPARRTLRRILEVVDAPLPPRTARADARRPCGRDRGRQGCGRAASQSSWSPPASPSRGSAAPIGRSSGRLPPRSMPGSKNCVAWTDRRDRSRPAAGSVELRRSERPLLVGTNRRCREGACSCWPRGRLPTWRARRGPADRA